MLQFISLGSGSSGNCYYLNADGQGLLIDLGLGIRLFRKHFTNYGLSLDSLKAILVTHDHTDHAKAVGALSRQFRIPVYATEKVHNSMLKNHFLSKKVAAEMRRDIAAGDTFQIGPYSITPFHVPHDSADCVGYDIQVGDIRLAILTDVGHFTDEMIPIVGQATHLIIEANYDPDLLAAGRYPLRLQKRISGGSGHTSNRQCAEFLAQHLNKDTTRRVWLCHLSEENNRPQLAETTVSEALQAAGFSINNTTGLKLEVLPRRTPTLLETL